jgi:ribosomal protein S18 acetylase RimI-like enzyme
MGPGQIEFGDTRRSDMDSFTYVAMHDTGAIGALTGMDKRPHKETRLLFRGPVWFLLRLLSAFNRAPVNAFAARDGKRVVSTNIVFFGKRSGYIAAVATDPAYKRRGIANKLLALAESRIRERGRRFSMLDVERLNTPAYNLYSSRGYKPVQKVTLYSMKGYGQGAPPAPTTSGKVEEVLGRSRLLEAAQWCGGHIPASCTGPFPPSRRMFTCMETIAGAIFVKTRTWVLTKEGATAGYVRAFFRSGDVPAHVNLPAAAAGVTKEEFGALVTAAMAWLKGMGARLIIFSLPDYLASAAPAVEAAGFVPSVDTYTMVLSL